MMVQDIQKRKGFREDLRPAHQPSAIGELYAVYLNGVSYTRVTKYSPCANKEPERQLAALQAVNLRFCLTDFKRVLSQG